MKKLLVSLLFWPLLLSAQTNSSIQFVHFTAGFGNLTCNPTGSNYVATASIGDGIAVITWASVSNCWVVSGLSPAGVIISPSGLWFTNTAYWAYGVRYPTNGTVYQVYGDQSGLITNNFQGVSTMTFTNFVAPTVTNWTTISTNYWSVPGDVVYFSGGGRNMSSATNANQLVISIDGNPVFTGPYTAAGGFGWRVSGSVQWDGTNLLSTGQFLSGDTNTPVGYDTELFTNVAVGRNAWQWMVLGDTNGLTFDSAGILAARAPSGDLPQHSFISTSSAPLTLNGGTVYPSNTWSLASITNAMPNFGFWVGNSNGQALVTLSLSNGVVRYLQVLR